MGGIGFMLLTIVIGCVFRVRGSCIHVENDEMLEYLCTGGDPSDLNAIPQRTEKIRINGMLIPVLSADIFSRFERNLWVLSCSHCGIMHIKADAFQRLLNLQHLSLDSNHLTTVRGVWFEQLEFLTYLDLNYNDIDTIEDSVFENLPSLVDLRISGNRLQCLNLDAMNHLTELKRIFLGENKEFRCPNAVSQFLEERGISFEPDPEWRRMPADTIYVPVPPVEDFTTTPTSVYHANTYPSRVPDRILIPPEIHSTQDVVTYPIHDHTTFRLPIFPTHSPVTYSSPEDITPVPTIAHTERDFVTHPPREWVTYSPEEPYTDSHPQVATYPPHESFTPDTAEIMPVSPIESSTDAPSEMILYPPYDPSVYPTPDPITFPLYTYPPESMTDTPVPLTNPPRHSYPLPYITSTASSPTMDSEEPWTQSENPLYPHENDFRQQPYYPSESSQSPSLATSPPDQTENSMKLNQEHASTASPAYPWPVDTSDYVVRGDDEIRTPKTTDNAEENMSTHAIRPYVPASTVQPAFPEEFFQAPYSEPTVTIRPPAVWIDYQKANNPAVTDVMPVETTTTDKPLPECPSRSSILSANLKSLLATVLIVMFRHVFMMGF